LLANGAPVAGAVVPRVLPAEERRAVGLGSRLTHGSLDDLATGQYRVILGQRWRPNSACSGRTRSYDGARRNRDSGGFRAAHETFLVVGMFESGMYESIARLALIT